MKFSLLLLLALLFVQVQAAEVTLYSVYPAEELEDVFAPFTEQTGIKVNVVTDASDKLLERMVAEGKDSPADLYLDKDIVFLGNAARAGVLKSFDSKTVVENTPSNFIDYDNRWFLFQFRTRQIIYNREVVNPSELSTYEDLASDKWRGRLCLRSSQKSYNQALGAYALATLGKAATVKMVKGWVKNLAQPVFNSDSRLIEALADGRCDVGVINSYYLPKYIIADANYPVRVFFPNQETTKTHINGIGVGLAKHTKKTKEATKVLEYLSSAELQTPLADAFHQFPVNPKATTKPLLLEFGAFEYDRTNLGSVSDLAEIARKLMLDLGYE